MKANLLLVLCVVAFNFSNLETLRAIPCDYSNNRIQAAPFEGAIEALILVDADTGEDLFLLEDGTELDIAQIKDQNLSIRLKTTFSEDPEDAAFFTNIRIDFELKGPLNYIWSERLVPYALFGDINGEYNGKVFPEGDYALWVGVDDSPADAEVIAYWDTRQINFSVGKVEHNIAAFYLINPELDFISWLVEDGTAINFVNNPLSFEARPGTYKVGSVVLELKGPLSYSATENFPPFTLFGDSEGKFAGKVLPEGAYTMTATPYSEAYEKGKAGTPLTIHFTIEFDRESFSLSTFMNMVDADSGANLETIFVFDKKTIDKKMTLTNNVSFVVYPNTPAIRSVYMALQGPTASFEQFVPPSHIQIENIAPHSMFGDIDGIFNGKSLEPGMYRITATPYSRENATGNGGFGRRFDFEITDSSTFLKSDINTVQSGRLLLFPNPSGDKVTIATGSETVIQKASVMNIFGQEIRTYRSDSISEQALDVSGLPKGLYFLQITTAEGGVTRKLLVQ